MTLSRLLPILLAACTPAVAPDGGSADGPPSVGGADTAAPRVWATDDGVASVAGQPPDPLGCSEVYAQDTLQTFTLDFDPDAWAETEAACAASELRYVPVTFGWGDERVAAHARLKGNWSWRCDKMQFVVSFNEDDPDGRFHGVRKLVFDAPWYDHTLLHERLAFSAFADRGLPGSCVNHARLEVDGAYYGLYANVERIDREYLERNFDDPTGDLYQAGVELKTNEETSDGSRAAALAAATTLDEIEAMVDLDQAVAEWATEAWLPAMDNYWAGVEINYYTYDHPSRGFVWLPYDLDVVFGDAAYPDGRIVWPDAVSADPIHHEHGYWGKEELFQTVLADPGWCARFVEEVARTQATVSPDVLVDRVRAWDDQIRSALVDDPRRPYSADQHDAAVAALQAFVHDRADFVQAWLDAGGHCPE